MIAYRQVTQNYLLPASILLLLIGVHFYFLIRYGINIPFSDDYNEILKKMNTILDSGTIKDYAGNLFNGDGYSKPITLRFISLLHLFAVHEINFKYLVFTGNIFLVLTCLVFIISVVNINKYLIVTIACFIFQPQYWEALYQATLSNSVFSCLFFSLASIYCATQKKSYFYGISLLLAVLAQLSFGNGFMVYPILLMVAFLQKNSRFFIAIFTIMAVCTYAYMLGDTTSYNVGQQMGVLTKVKLCSLWLLEFLGSSVGYACGSGYERGSVGKTASIMIGLLVVSLYAFVIKKKYYHKNILLFSFLTFFILTALLATPLRYSMEVPGASRYQIQSALCILTALIVMVDLYIVHLNRYIIIALTIVFPLMFTFVSYKTNVFEVSCHKSRLANELWLWLDTGKGLTIWSGQEAAALVLRRSIKRNMYRIPSRQTLIMEAFS